MNLSVCLCVSECVYLCFPACLNLFVYFSATLLCLRRNIFTFRFIFVVTNWFSNLLSPIEVASLQIARPHPESNSLNPIHVQPVNNNRRDIFDCAWTSLLIKILPHRHNKSYIFYSPFGDIPLRLADPIARTLQPP